MDQRGAVISELWRLTATDWLLCTGAEGAA